MQISGGADTNAPASQNSVPSNPHDNKGNSKDCLQPALQILFMSACCHETYLTLSPVPYAAPAAENGLNDMISKSWDAGLPDISGQAVHPAQKHAAGTMSYNPDGDQDEAVGRDTVQALSPIGARWLPVTR